MFSIKTSALSNSPTIVVTQTLRHHGIGANNDVSWREDGACVINVLVDGVKVARGVGANEEKAETAAYEDFVER